MIPMNRDWSSLRKLMFLRGNPATGGGGGSPLTVSGQTPLLMPGALAKPMRKATFAIIPVQSGSGDPSPSNVRPITGWTGCTAWVIGKNLSINAADRTITNQTTNSGEGWQKSLLANNIIISSLAYNGDAWYSVTQYPMTISVSGTTISYSKEGANNAFGIGICVEVPGNTKLYFGSNRTKTGVNSSMCLFYDENKYYISKTDASTTDNVTTPPNARYAVFTFRITVGASESVSDFWVSPMQNAGYTPYSGTTVSVEFPALGKNLFGSAVGRFLWANDGNRYDNTSGPYCGSEKKIAILGGENYTVSLKNSAVTNSVLVRWYSDNTILSYSQFYNSNSGTVSAPNGANYASLTFRNTEDYTGDATVYDVMVEKGDTAHAYEPYTSTVYSGTIDPVTGEGVVTHRCVDLGSLTWTYRSTQQMFTAIVTALDYKVAPNNTTVCNAISSAYKALNISGMLDNLSNNNVFTLGRTNNWDKYLMVRNTSYTDADAFKTAVTGVQMVYELNTPIPFTIPPQSITPPAGDAYIWADCGSSAEVTYIGKP